MKRYEKGRISTCSYLSSDESGEEFEEKGNQKWAIQQNFQSLLNHSDSHEKQVVVDQDHTRFTYCYLCSIDAHVHQKTQPVPVEKRRYLKPYTNPLALIKKYEQIQQDLVNKTKYKFSIKTGPGKYAGTNSRVYFKLFGSSGKWDQTQLKVNNIQNNLKFPPGLVEVELDGPFIGDLRKLKIWHEGKSPKDGWYLESVDISCPTLKQQWTFKYDNWLSIHRPPDHKASVVLEPLQKLPIPKFINSYEYFLILTTGKNSFETSDSSVLIQLVGEKSQSPILNLTNPYLPLFGANQLDAFLIQSSSDLGKPDRIKMAAEVGGKRVPHEWQITDIRMTYSKEENKFFCFKLEKWVEKGNKLNALITSSSPVAIDSSIKSESGKMLYYITIKTANEKFAGTDSKVYIEIYGTKGKTGIHRLNSNSKHLFERNKTDHFQIFDVHVGNLKAVRIWHDNSGAAPGWLLETVLIKCAPTSITGHKEKQDVELRDQLDKLKQKILIRDLGMEKYLDSSRPHQKRSSSAELSKSLNEIKMQKQRSKSAGAEKNSPPVDPSLIDFKKMLRKKLDGDEMSRANTASPTSSILKTTPRTRKEMMKKQVKFKPEEKEVKKEGAKPAEVTKSDMKISWVMSIQYDNNSIQAVRSIDQFEIGLKNINEKMIEKFKELVNQKETASKETSEPSKETQKDEKSEIEKFIFVFECRQWLSKDSTDKKIERTLKVSNILNTR